ncbi:hypothetical protein DYB32_006955 [Aphanomyces invadans]|uniref:ribose-phosphate diphosphokinase n=1 Tax=Aphanomyces invadans TaxID=157072 RepID=A0A3R6YZR7_9STRA|nr:hypothetical protein DYB32_006955 [Aphanomyces invadans]
MFLRHVGRSKATAAAAAASLGLLCGVATSAPASYNKDSLTTKRWHFYKGKMHPNVGKTVKLFKCDDTPIADEIASYLGIQLSDMTVSRFADGETSIHVNENVRGQRVYIVSSTITVDRIMELLLSIAAMRRASAKSIVAVIPFYGYARQDMVSKGRGPISAADVARMLEEMGVDHAITTLNECKDLDLVVTTNTIACSSTVEAEKSSKIVTLSVAPFLAEAISCIHMKGSMSQKFALSAS